MPNVSGYEHAYEVVLIGEEARGSEGEMEGENGKQHPWELGCITVKQFSQPPNCYIPFAKTPTASDASSLECLTLGPLACPCLEAI